MRSDEAERDDGLLDPVNVVTSMDVRDLLVVGNNFTLFEEDDPDTVPSYLDACVNTPAGQTVDEREAFDYVQATRMPTVSSTRTITVPTRRQAFR